MELQVWKCLVFIFFIQNEKCLRCKCIFSRAMRTLSWDSHRRMWSEWTDKSMISHRQVTLEMIAVVKPVTWMSLTKSPHRKMSSCGRLCCKPRQTSPSCTQSWTRWRTCMQTRELNTRGEILPSCSCPLNLNMLQHLVWYMTVCFVAEKRMNWRGWFWNTSHIPVTFSFSSKYVFHLMKTHTAL